ncbi:RsiV family protein [Bacillus sp. Marseille-P3661]|uniref:RsiV family protein n=1 Tax=Bacillus sp. Marseille-P3661 TaxID=1936234 RepID=UPI000C83F4BA|nr:RsiV family protein [Bacillus sp. Marseille-P3661]
MINEYVYSGGAHGTPIKIDFTYDIKEEKENSLMDLFKTDDFVHVLTELAKENIQNSDIKDLLFNDFEQIRKEQDFYLTDDALVLIFGQYEYTAGAAGSPEFFIEKEHLEILKDKFK